MRSKSINGKNVHGWKQPFNHRGQVIILNKDWLRGKYDV